MEVKASSIHATDEISLPEAAMIIGVTRQRAYVYTLTGRLPARKVAGRFAVLRSDAEALREQRKAATNLVPA